MKKQKTERQKLVKKLDDIFSLYIRTRDKRSVFSGSSENLQCFHIFSRVSYGTRWEEWNAFAATSAENIKYEYDTYFINHVHNWYIGRFGKPMFEMMNRKYYGITKFSNADLKMLIEHFKNKLEALGK